jgi:hypothetical protein
MKDNGKNEYLMEEQNKEGSFFLTASNIKPNYNVTFHNGERNIGRLDFNSDAMVFEGDAEESAQVFFDLLAKYFADRLKQEREKEREACARMCEAMGLGHVVAFADDCAEAIRTRGEK